tara:strand:+ start:6067 stop:6324 length:258 start_codon:yes stop_codon:yes gene_type:complete
MMGTNTTIEIDRSDDPEETIRNIGKSLAGQVTTIALLRLMDSNSELTTEGEMELRAHVNAAVTKGGLVPKKETEKNLQALISDTR